MFAATQDNTAVAMQLRVAFTLCPMCKATGTLKGGTKSFFEVDDQPDREYMVHSVLPAVIATGAREYLWVGVQAFTLRYECVPPTLFLSR